MISKVWVCFDSDGDVLHVCNDEDRPGCSFKDCELYVMKLIPVKKEVEELREKLEEMKKADKDFDEVVKGLNASSRRLKRSLDRFKI